VDCCSLEGRTLKQDIVAKLLTEFVLVRLEPMDWDEDKAFGERFGLTEFPALLFLDWKAEKKLGAVGDVSAEKVAAALGKALGR
jgi:hypothetical protein